jgi:hypothetical protein
MIMRLGIGLFLCFLLLAEAGCLRGPFTWQRLTINHPISAHDVGFIVDGVTRFPDVVDRLGSPDELTPVGDSLVARYHFSDGKYFKGDYGWGLRFVLPFFAPDLVLGGGGFGTDILQVSCDPQWIVQEHAFAWHANSSEFRLWPFGETAP